MATLVYSVMRLGEKEFVDVLGPTLFMKKEHELKQSKAGRTIPNERIKRPVSEIAAKWAQIKTLRNTELASLASRGDARLTTHEDWMIAALLALNE